MAAVALLLAAGRGERLGCDTAKAFVLLAGQPMLAWSLEVLAATAAIGRIVVALPPDWSPIHLQAERVELATVPGGPSRSASVRAALAAAGDGDPVVVHDAARPAVTTDLCERVLAELAHGGCEGAIAAAPVTDTVKRADPERVVRETLDRGSLWAVQTPQAFRRDALERALDIPDQVLATATDDAWLVERSGGRIRIVPGPPENLKVTTPLDLRVVELLLGERPGRTAGIGGLEGVPAC